jgi:hypothetical protein
MEGAIRRRSESLRAKDWTAVTTSSLIAPLGFVSVIEMKST